MNFRSAEECIEYLHLQPHPEGGYYQESYRSLGTINPSSLPSTIDGERNYATAIYFLLENGQSSRFHRIQSDELWFFHQGSAFEISVVDQKGVLTRHVLGSDWEAGQSLQLVVPAQSWFGAKLVAGFANYGLVSCVVAPGFDFRDFELAKAFDFEKWPAMRDVPELCPPLHS